MTKKYQYEHEWTMHRVVDGIAHPNTYRESDGWDMISGPFGVEFQREVHDMNDVLIGVQAVNYPHTSYSTMEVNARIVKEIK